MIKKIFYVIIIFIAAFLVFNIKDQSVLKVVNYASDNLKISIDGEAAYRLPTSGSYYLANYDCKNTNTKVTWDNDSYKLNITNKTKKSGVSCYLNFKTYPFLNEMPIGSYVKFIGNNGCVGDSCSGYNANYIDSNDMGYCNNSNFKFINNGFRIGYKSKGNVYLISAGATDCMCSNSDGSISSKSCNSYLSGRDVEKHYVNMNDIAIKYCNPNYAKDGVCNSNTSWAMNANDFNNMTGNKLSDNSCYESSGNRSCGYNNDLIDNGSFYWISSNNSNFSWSPDLRFIRRVTSNNLLGIRPVLLLDSTVIVLSGNGTIDSPYIIGNNTISIGKIKKHLEEDNKSIFLDLKLNATLDLVKTMCIGVDTTVCTNYKKFVSNYELDITDYEEGKHIIYVYYKDVNNKIVASINKEFLIDLSDIS